MNEISRNNHYVPQFYLENWGTQNKIWKYQLLVSNEKVPLWTNNSIKHTASCDNLYVRVEKDSEVDDFEKMFDSKFESATKKAMDKAINDEKLSMDDWKNLIDFVGAQMVRTPAFYQRIRPVIHDSLQNGLEEILEELGNLTEIPTDLPPKRQIDDLIPIKCSAVENVDSETDANIKVEVLEGKNTWLWAMLHLLGNPLKILHQHKWSIITCEAELPTSDDPVICLNYYNKNNYDFNGGWKRKGTEIMCPISPHKILYTQVGMKHSPRIKYNKEQSQMLKELIIKHAYREIYAANVDKEVCTIRQREINAEMYKEEKQMMEEWYRIYKDTEGELL